MRYIIVHERDGIFVGHGMGLAFFSALDPADQTQCVTFESQDYAQEFVSVILASTGETYTVQEISGDAEYASIADLETAGYGKYLDLMRQAFLREIGAAGSA